MLKNRLKINSKKVNNQLKNTQNKHLEKQENSKSNGKQNPISKDIFHLNKDLKQSKKQHQISKLGAKIKLNNF